MKKAAKFHLKRAGRDVCLCALAALLVLASGTGVYAEAAAVSEAEVTSESAAAVEDGEAALSVEGLTGVERAHVYDEMSAEEIVSCLTLEQKAAQMVQPACYWINEAMMEQNCYGSVLSQSDSKDYLQWQDYIGGLQDAALASDAGIPFIYGQDDVHGVNYALGTVIFPHNIGLGAADDEELMYEIGRITADEAKLCRMLWNFAPVVAQSADPRWGRTYESYGYDLDRIKTLSTAYTKGLQDNGVAACAKHFFGDGNAKFGTGENSDVERLIDRGDAILTDEEIDELLSVYQAQIDAGVKTIMISHSSLNGVKMHENKEYIDRLKNEMGFEGFVVSDWDSIQNTSPDNYYDQVVTAVNAGIDMLMEHSLFDEARVIIEEAVENGDIPAERVDDAVTRIIQVKKDMGIFRDPYGDELKTGVEETGTPQYRKTAEKAVEESLVLLKNEGDVLPLKEGTSIYITGPAANDDRTQCGGWTIGWNSSPDSTIPGVTNIKEAFAEMADECGFAIYTKDRDADKADVVLLVLGEESYAEWNGDAENMDLCGDLGLAGNLKAIEKAKELGKPVVVCIVAGRQVLIDKYIDDWDAAVMCYLPGSEGRGVVNVLSGKAEFSGTLPSPWYSSTDQIGTEECWLPVGYGLTY